MSERVARMMARITAGSEMKEPGRGSILNVVNSVMAAAGLGKAGRIGTFILLANYCDSADSRLWAEQWLLKWSWSEWLKTGDKSAKVTTGEMERLVSVVMGQHICPEAGRRTSKKIEASIIGIGAHTLKNKYGGMHGRMIREIQYQESVAISAIERGFRERLVVVPKNS
ncbi:MAG: hypothetical protein KOO63_08105 [Bacteroidales bacterium]|nr:hypothetical protein [Candidatus Latescibacterota bacterium]